MNNFNESIEKQIERQSKENEKLKNAQNNATNLNASQNEKVQTKTQLSSTNLMQTTQSSNTVTQSSNLNSMQMSNSVSSANAQTKKKPNKVLNIVLSLLPFLIIGGIILFNFIQTIIPKTFTDDLGYSITLNYSYDEEKDPVSGVHKYYYNEDLAIRISVVKIEDIGESVENKTQSELLDINTRYYAGVDPSDGAAYSDFIKKYVSEDISFYEYYESQFDETYFVTTFVGVNDTYMYTTDFMCYDYNEGDFDKEVYEFAKSIVIK